MGFARFNSIFASRGKFEKLHSKNFSYPLLKKPEKSGKNKHQQKQEFWAR